MRKRCSSCGMSKPASCFSPNRMTSTGLASKCKPCNSQAQKIWRLKNPERRKAIMRRWRSNPENRMKERISGLLWRKKNAARVRKNERAAQERLRTAILDHYGRICVCCHEQESRFLVLDHVGGWGRLHRKRVGISMVYKDLRQRGFPKLKSLRILCMNCNWSTRFGDPCPHEIRAAV